MKEKLTVIKIAEQKLLGKLNQHAWPKANVDQQFIFHFHNINLLYVCVLN